MKTVGVAVGIIIAIPLFGALMVILFQALIPLFVPLGPGQVAADTALGMMGTIPVFLFSCLAMIAAVGIWLCNRQR